MNDTVESALLELVHSAKNSGFEIEFDGGKYYIRERYYAGLMPDGWEEIASDEDLLCALKKAFQNRRDKRR